MYLRTCALSEVSDQPAHLRRLIRICTWHILDSQLRMWTTKTLVRLRGCATDLSLRMAHMSEGTFSHVETHTRVARIRPCDVEKCEVVVVLPICTGR